MSELSDFLDVVDRGVLDKMHADEVLESFDGGIEVAQVVQEVLIAAVVLRYSAQEVLEIEVVLVGLVRNDRFLEVVRNDLGVPALPSLSSEHMYEKPLLDAIRSGWVFLEVALHIADHDHQLVVQLLQKLAH